MSRALFVALLVIALHARLAAAGSEMAFLNLGRAKAQVQTVCARIAQETSGATACPSAPITITVKEDEQAPPRLVAAYFTMPAGQGGGCTITAVPRALRDMETMAHEACHCAYDHADVGARGWLLVDAAEIAARESRARECAAAMVGRRR